MRQIVQRVTGLRTSVLGYGCAALTSINDPERARHLLELAFEHGVTHFDVARVYGFGHAEQILGTFLRDKRTRVTVTTKFGLQPSLPRLAKPSLVRAIKAVLRRFPALERRARSRAQQFVARGGFTPQEAANSLEASLRALATDHVDVLLLHECTVVDATNHDLLRFLEDQVRAGRVRHIGIGTDYRTLEGDLSRFPAAYQIFQFDHNPLVPTLETLTGLDTRGVVTHGALKVLRPIREAAQNNAAITSQYGERLGFDVADPERLASLLLHYALAANAEGPVLFATTNERHLVANLRQAEEDRYSPDQLADFAAFARTVLCRPSPSAT